MVTLMSTPQAYMLIGLPGVGKSTWLNKEFGGKIAIASSDNFIEFMASQIGKTYDEMFDVMAPLANAHLQTAVQIFTSNNLDFVWDQTNLGAKARKSKIAKIPEAYDITAVVWNKPGFDNKIWRQRLASRPGKHIPDSVINSMYNSFQYPTMDEGFAKIVDVDWKTGLNNLVSA